VNTEQFVEAIFEGLLMSEGFRPAAAQLEFDQFMAPKKEDLLAKWMPPPIRRQVPDPLRARNSQGRGCFPANWLPLEKPLVSGRCSQFHPEPPWNPTGRYHRRRSVHRGSSAYTSRPS